MDWKLPFSVRRSRLEKPFPWRQWTILGPSSNVGSSTITFFLFFDYLFLVNCLCKPAAAILSALLLLLVLLRRLHFSELWLFIPPSSLGEEEDEEGDEEENEDEKKLKKTIEEEIKDEGKEEDEE